MFVDIVLEVHLMSGFISATEQDFFKWLTSNVRTKKVQEIYLVFKELEKIALRLHFCLLRELDDVQLSNLKKQIASLPKKNRKRYLEVLDLTRNFMHECKTIKEFNAIDEIHVSSRDLSHYLIPNNLRCNHNILLQNCQEEVAEREHKGNDPLTLKKKRIEQVLQEAFPTGFQADSFIDKMRFLHVWEVLFGEKLPDEEASSIIDLIKKLTIQVNDSPALFSLPENLISQEKKLELKQLIQNEFNQGVKAIFYSALYQNQKKFFLSTQIYTPQMLAAYLKFVYADLYCFNPLYFTEEDSVSIDPVEEIADMLKLKKTSASSKTICKELSHIPAKKIKNLLVDTDRFIRNKKGEFFLADIVIVHREEMALIKTLLDKKLAADEFLASNDFYQLLEIHCPEFLTRYNFLSELGVRNLFSYRLKNLYSFNGPIISKKGENLAIRDVFEKFASSHDTTTIIELRKLKTALESGQLYFDAIHKYLCRVNEKDYVAKENLNFDIEKTDIAIKKFMTDDYIFLKEITHFGSFPTATLPWNEYLLETYVAFFSYHYELIHTNFNETQCLGAIVSRDSKISTLYDLVVRVLRDSEIELIKEKALDYLYENRLLGRRSYADIDNALSDAQLQRQMKG